MLRYAVEQGINLPGAWVVGEVQRGRLREPRPVLAGTLTERAERSPSSVLGGSSTGGEQPKFTMRQGAASMVKFSPPTDERSGARWADLLLAEHLAARLLGAHGITAASTEVVDEDARRFLVVKRFDRHGPHGRSGMVSLLSLDADGVGSDIRSWGLVTAALQERGSLSPADHEQARWLEAFGHLIANNDMHMGNLSLTLDGTTITGLAPVYDMLPMFHAPRHGVIAQSLYDPRGQHDGFPSCAVALARRFWQELREHPRRLRTLDAVCEGQLRLLPGAA